MPLYTHDELFPPDLIVIPCGAQKDPYPRSMPARDRYTGAHFRLGYEAACAFAERLGHIPDVSHSIRILSAKLGLIRPHLSIWNYDLKMGDPGCIEPGDLVRDLDHRQPVRIHALTPAAYTDVLTAAAARMVHPAEVIRYFDGCRGIGDQRGVLARIKRGEEPLRVAS